MLRNYLIIAWRNILKNRTFTFINIFGLAFGMAACMMVLQYVGFELNYDTFHTKKDRIYRVGVNFFKNEQWSKWLVTGPGYIQMKYEFPEIENIVRFVDIWEVILTYEPPNGQAIHHKEKGIFYADSTLFNVFDFKLVKGNADKVLREKDRMLISESAAKKWFGDETPIGKTLRIDNEEAFVIEGVLQDIPQNSHIHFDYLLSFNSLKPRTDRPLDEDMLLDDTYTYLLLHQGIDPDNFVKKINGRFDDYFAYIRRLYGEWSGHFLLQPLTQIQTTTDFHKDVAPRQNSDKLYALALIGILILLMAWINYINLATVRSIERSKEVGIRKAIGATRRKLTEQFLTEAMVLNVSSFLVAIAIVALSQDYFSQITGWAIYSQLWLLPHFWITLILSFFIGSLLSGWYPAFILTAYQPTIALKGGYQSPMKGKNIRSILSVVQYTASISLLIGTIIIYSQIEYLQQQKLGFDMEQTFVVRVPSLTQVSEEAHEAFKHKAMAIKGVNSFTFSSNIPGNKVNKGVGHQARIFKENDPNAFGFDTFGGVDYNFLDFYDIELKEGRFFQPENSSDSTAFVISEKSVQKLGYDSMEDALGNTLILAGGWRYEGKTEEDSKGQIIGIIEDINVVAPNIRDYETNSGGALGLLLTLGDHLSPLFKPQYYSLKVNMANWQKTEIQIKKAFQEVYPDEMYEYFFQDEFYNRQYQSDIQFLNIFVFFALQAVFIACLGLFGLAAYQVQKRSKEIGIRKVLGANISDIWLLLAKDLLKALLIASIIGIPLINYFMKSWLEEFVYKIPLSWWMFALPVVLMILIALLTVSQHLRRAARLNPVKLLRYE